MSIASDFVIENGVLTKYLGKDKDVVIPEGVTAIGTEAFRRKGVVRLTMPDTVTEVGWGAFSSCTSLEEVAYSKNLKVIAPNAFGNCQQLRRVELYAGLERIDSCAFSGCIKLQELNLPEHPIEIGRAAFGTCPSLVDENGFCIVRGVLYSYNSQYPEKMHIPDGVKYILESAGFDQYHVRSLSIPASVEIIEDGTFQGLHNLRECTIGFSVTELKEAQRLVKKVFSWEGLALAYVQGGLQADTLIVDAVKKQIASKSGRETMIKRVCGFEDGTPMFRLLGCVKKLPLEELDEAIEHADIPAVRAVLLEYKQEHYTPKKVAKALQNASDKELGVKGKTLTDWRKELKITKKGDRYVVTGFKDDIASEAAFAHKEYSGVITIPAQIGGVPVEMGERVFQNCSYVKTVIIEEGVEKIGAFSFSGCSKLRDVYVPASVTDFGEYGAAFYCEPRQSPFTIHAPAGSYAETYAKEHNIPFVAE